MAPFLTLLIAAVPPPELGAVAWLRDFEAARAQSRTSGKPMLVLFDEVPGCSTVLGFGQTVLANEDVVRRIERDFVPIAIFNNVGGADRRLLERFGEPAWNNPVVRVMDAELRELAPRFSGPYSVKAFTWSLDAVRPASAPQTLLVSAHCFWECEARLGRLPAVVSSRVGFLRGEEVVEVQFDPTLASRAAMVSSALELDCANHVFSRTEAEHSVTKPLAPNRAVLTTEPLRVSEKDTKYYLRRQGMDATLTPLEQVRVNAALRFGEDPERARASCSSTGR